MSGKTSTPLKLKTLPITDAIAAQGGAAQTNTIWIGKVAALQAQ